MEFKHVSRNWLYTAVTRATHLKNVKFFSKYCRDDDSQSDFDDEDCDSDDDDDDEIVNKYFERKVKGYVKQDIKADRAIEDNYVNVEWLSKCIGKKCGRCQTGLYCDVDNADCNITAQRIDNSLCHSIDNIIPYCVNCNVSQSNK